MVRIDYLIVGAKRYESVRQIRWPDDLRRVWFRSDQVKRRGLRRHQHERQPHHYKACKNDFDDLTNTVFARYQRSKTSGNYRDRGRAQIVVSRKNDFCPISVSLNSRITFASAGMPCPDRLLLCC
jgi:hypothetical protein